MATAAINSGVARRVAKIAGKRCRRMLRYPRMLEIRLPASRGLMAYGACGRKMAGGRRVALGAILAGIVLHRRLRPLILIMARQTIGADVGFVRALMTRRTGPI